MFYSQREEKSCPLDSVMKPSELLCQGYIVHWCSAINIQPKEEKVKDIPIVVSSEKFSEKVTRTAPPREIDFEIEFIPSA